MSGVRNIFREIFFIPWDQSYKPYYYILIIVLSEPHFALCGRVQARLTQNNNQIQLHATRLVCFTACWFIQKVYNCDGWGGREGTLYCI